MVSPSPIEREREGYLQQINNQGRRLENIAPDEVKYLNDELKKVVGRLVKLISTIAKLKPS